jgi:lysophospholipase L1-like esterase
MTVVAVGDSYASGEGAIGSGWINAACERSSLAGPQDAAGRLGSRRPVAFTSLACFGANTSGVLAQLSSLPPGNIDALTMSVGGNDIGFTSIVMNCMSPFDCTGIDPAVTSALAALPTSLAAVFAAVPSRVANVFVTEYPDPTTGPLGIRCGSPLAPGFEGLDGIDESEAAWASSRVLTRLNATLAAAVAAADARPGPHPRFRFVTGISARFATHGYCTGGGSPAPWTWGTPRYINTVVDSQTSQGLLNANGTMHPNDLGQQAIGEALYDAMFFMTVGDIRVPDVVGHEPGEAANVIRAAGLTVAQASVPDDGCNYIGTVVRQSPAAHSLLWSQETVTLTVAEPPSHPCP